MIMVTVVIFGGKLAFIFFFLYFVFKRNTDTNNTGPCRTMDIMMIDSQMCLHNKWKKKKVTIALTTLIHIKTSHLCIKKCKCES